MLEIESAHMWCLSMPPMRVANGRLEVWLFFNPVHCHPAFLESEGEHDKQFCWGGRMGLLNILAALPQK